ncbi:PadR family transcriptional regulator [Caproiciproducens sp. MSJ-32]|uniref:PadR family transcriptional regulator n=1 Tax=Caproiciproducens sp. MSJ-32 TaxID=2841527 RepID=UPI001C121B53|nr:PadR family transcriptional regulator [Caproiciproducens sp. MSJ-32]
MLFLRQHKILISDLEANTLYPLLRRLEKQGILESLWDTDGTKPRKYYKLSVLGETVYLKLCEARL